MSLDVSREGWNSSGLWPEKCSHTIRVCNASDIRELILTKLKKAVQYVKQPVVTKTKSLLCLWKEDGPVCKPFFQVFSLSSNVFLKAETSKWNDWLKKNWAESNFAYSCQEIPLKSLKTACVEMRNKFSLSWLCTSYHSAKHICGCRSRQHFNFLITLSCWGKHNIKYLVASKWHCSYLLNKALEQLCIQPIICNAFISLKLTFLPQHCQCSMKY